MSLATIRTQITTILSGIANIGVVHDYERWAADWKLFLAEFKTTIDGQDRIQGWTITRESTPAEDFDTEREWRSHLMILRGYRGLNDTVGSEKEFQDLLETVCTTLRAQRPGNLAGIVSKLAPAQVRIVEHRLLGDVLVHYGEITVTAHDVE